MCLHAPHPDTPREAVFIPALGLSMLFCRCFVLYDIEPQKGFTPVGLDSAALFVLPGPVDTIMMPVPECNKPNTSNPKTLNATKTHKNKQTPQIPKPGHEVLELSSHAAGATQLEQALMQVG